MMFPWQELLLLCKLGVRLALETRVDSSSFMSGSTQKVELQKHRVSQDRVRAQGGDQGDAGDEQTWYHIQFCRSSSQKKCFLQWCLLSESVQVPGEGLTKQKLSILLVVLKYLEGVHLDKNQPQMLFLIDSVPGGFCGSGGCGYITATLSKCPSLPLGVFLSSPPDFSCCVRRAVGLEGNGDISTASCPGLFLCTKGPFPHLEPP